MSSSVFALKSQMIPLTVIELSSQDNQAFGQQLEEKVKASPALFDRMPAILGLDDIEPIDESTVQKLLFTIRKFNILPVAIRGSDELKSLAQKLDLAWIPPGRKKLQKQAQKAKEDIEAANKAIETKADIHVENVSNGVPEQLELAAQASEHQTSAPSNSEITPAASDPKSSHLPSEESGVTEVSTAPPPTKIISTPVRSGQQIYAKDCDLIILSQVGQGAEVIADGNIHIYGTLRGRAIAGANGNKNARIFCQSLQAELISIAGIYQVSDDLPADQIGQSSQVVLKENHLHIDTL